MHSEILFYTVGFFFVSNRTKMLLSKQFRNEEIGSALLLVTSAFGIITISLIPSAHKFCTRGAVADKLCTKH